MPDLPTRPTQMRVVNALVHAGGRLNTKRGKGSHMQVYMPDIARPITVPRHIDPTLLASIIRQAGVTRDAFLEVY